MNIGNGLTKLEEKAFERAVVRATATISQNLASMHRRRLVTQTAVAVAAIVAIVAVAIVIIIRNTDAAYGCRVEKQISQVMTDFVQSDASLRQASQQNIDPAVLKGFQKIIPPKALSKAQAQSNSYNAATVKHWLTVDVPQLQTFASMHCR